MSSLVEFEGTASWTFFDAFIEWDFHLLDSVLVSACGTIENLHGELTVITVCFHGHGLLGVAFAIEHCQCFWWWRALIFSHLFVLLLAGCVFEEFDVHGFWAGSTSSNDGGSEKGQDSKLHFFGILIMIKVIANPLINIEIYQIFDFLFSLDMYLEI